MDSRIEIGVSVVLPIHGDAPFLESCLESISSQTYDGDLQVVAVLDRAHPGVEKRIAKAINFETLIVKSPIGGLVPALNLGLTEARFEFIARMDSDDIMLPDRIQAQSDFLQGNSAIAVVGGQILTCNYNGLTSGRRNYPTRPSDVRHAMANGCCVPHPGVMFRRSAAIAVGAYRTRYNHAEDYDLWTRMLRDSEIANLDTYVLIYREHMDQVSVKSSLQQRVSTVKISHNFKQSSKRARSIKDRVSLRRRLILSLTNVYFEDALDNRRKLFVGVTFFLIFLLSPIQTAFKVIRKIRAIKI